MNDLIKLVRDTYTENIDKYERECKDHVAHRRQDLELIVAGLERLTQNSSPDEYRLTTYLVGLLVKDELNDKALSKIQEIAFNVTSGDTKKLYDRVVAVVTSCSERPTHQRVSNPIQSLWEALSGAGEKKEEKVQ